MDSVYLLQQKEKITVADLIARIEETANRLEFNLAQGTVLNKPRIRISKSTVDLFTPGERGDIIFVDFDSDENLFKPCSIFPKSWQGKDYYAVIYLKCEEPMDLLAFILTYLQAFPDQLIYNVEARLQSKEELERHFKEECYEWAYLE